jgi:crotonobetainyl-CoA:carnitine CoA-transferase CaiB-like acyl-CoA transferase
MEDVFKDLKVIDLSTVLAGPSVGTFFAELGADVLKVEPHGNGDVTRSWKLPNENPKASVSAYFSSVNFKKKYIRLNLLDSKDHERLMNHIKHADVLISNFKKGDDKKLNIEDKTLRKTNPKLIIGKISGFGNASDRIAYDLILQAESGFMSINGEANQAPLKMPIALIDVLAAHHLKEGILLSLLAQKAQTVHVSLYDAAVCSLMNQASNYLMTGNKPQQQGNLHPNIAPYGELFKTVEGEWVTFAIGSNRHFNKLCEVLELGDLKNSGKFNTNQSRVKHRAELSQHIETQVKDFSTKALLKNCLEQQIPCAQIKTIHSVLDDSSCHPLIRSETIDGIETRRLTSIAAKWS